MTRDAGFAVMDVSTAIVYDPKFRRVQRGNPAHLALAFMAYVAVMAESWKAGVRVSVADAWPTLVAFDEGVAASMIAARLLDARGKIPAKTWDGWYRLANERREKARERWRRGNEKRAQMSTNDSVPTASAPRGSSDVTDTTVPTRTVPSSYEETSRVRATADHQRFDRDYERTMAEVRQRQVLPLSETEAQGRAGSFKAKVEDAGFKP